ncbi:winged helix-turn-helix domain-containing protein [Streptomyces sp. NPDC090080]|uniref:winged helix-turn-helix domain-containing protein n=1 Tax=Streptomyces sp. NPDC090080 TaxID=3365939 RepID=UPI003820435B
MTKRTKDGGAFQRVSEELRVRLSDGGYPLGSFLPSQETLAQEFGVSRDTVQRALRELGSEGWIESGRGKRSRVVMRQHIQSSAPRASRSRHHPMTLGPLIGEAFERDEVTLDISTLTSESLDAHIRVQAERIRAGDISPRRVQLRMLLPSETQDMPYPRAKDHPDDPRLPERLRAITTATRIRSHPDPHSSPPPPGGSTRCGNCSRSRFRQEGTFRLAGRVHRGSLITGRSGLFSASFIHRFRCHSMCSSAICLVWRDFERRSQPM